MFARLLEVVLNSPMESAGSSVAVFGLAALDPAVFRPGVPASTPAMVRAAVFTHALW